jgi:galactokinase
LTSLDLNATATIPLAGAITPGEPSWANYPRGVLAGFQKRGVDMPGFRAVMTSDIPLGGGLSSSAAFEVAMASLLESITGQVLAPLDKALLCQWAEHHYPGMPCGLMDQYTSVFGQRGHLVLLDCRDRTHRLVPFDDPSVAVLIADTRVKHELTGGEYAERRSQCEEAARLLEVSSLRESNPDDLANATDRLPPVVFRRARHVVGEITRTVRAAERAERREWDAFGALMAESHRSLCDDFEVSCPELNAMVEAAWAIGPNGGIHGSRMTGGGFGGCTVSLVEAERVDEIGRALSETYARRTGIVPSIFATRPADGARTIELT